MIPEERMPESFPGFWGSLRVVAATLVLGIVCVTLLPRVDVPTAQLIAIVVPNLVVLGAFMRRRRLRFLDIAHPSPASPGATIGVLALPILLITPAVFLAGCVLDDLVQLVVEVPERQRQFFEALMGGGMLSFLLVAVIAPAFEEFLFRGVVLRGLAERMTPWRAIGASAVIFGLAHLNVHQFVGAGALGVVLAWLYVRFRSILPSFMLHAASNAANFAAVAYGGIDVASTDLPLWFWFMSAVLALAGAWMLHRLAGSAKPAGGLRQSSP